jgi:hypothetical protein
MIEQQLVTIHKTEKANSYEFGKAGNRFKVFFDTAEELKAEIDKLKDLGLYNESLD